MAAVVEVCGRSATTARLCRLLFVHVLFVLPQIRSTESPPFSFVVGCCDHGQHPDAEV